jgi:hypothetical protein
LVENTNINNKTRNKKLLYVLPKSAKTHVRTYTISQISPRVLPPTPLNREGAGRGGEKVSGRDGGEEIWVEGWEGEREGGRGREEGRERGMYASIHMGDQRRWFFHCSKITVGQWAMGSVTCSQ